MRKKDEGPQNNQQKDANQTRQPATDLFSPVRRDTRILAIGKSAPISLDVVFDLLCIIYSFVI